jgi:3'-phosphoadenosine 5'-phosphosulfate sulfotransferase (PAPS reductase)/FAD synthetase
MTKNLIGCGSGEGTAKLVTLGRVIAKARPFGATDRGVEFTGELLALLGGGAPVAIGVSGGKDSVAAALATVEFLDGIGHTGPRILIHADLGDPDPRLDVEWSDSLPTCERLAAHLGLELLIARRPAGGMMKRWLTRWENNKRRYASLSCVRLILPWSTPKMRFCTSELKSAPMASALVKRFPGMTIISACGVRRAESPDRSMASTTKVNNRLTNKARKTTGLDWNPIAAWSEDDVYAFCASRGFDLHVGYTHHGMSRISCRFCIMSKIADLKASAATPGHGPLFRTMVGLETESTFGFQGSRWLGDVAPELLDDAGRAALESVKRRAAEREAIEKRVPAHLLYTKGWPTVMPTREEAEMLCEVRKAVAALLGIEVGYTEPEAVLARYAELMTENAARTAAKAATSARKATKAAKAPRKVRA